MSAPASRFRRTPCPCPVSTLVVEAPRLCVCRLAPVQRIACKMSAEERCGGGCTWVRSWERGESMGRGWNAIGNGTPLERAFEGRPLIIQACGYAGAVQARRAPRRSPASWTCIRSTSSPGPLRNLPMLNRAPGCSICRRTTFDTFLDLPVFPLPVPSDNMTPPCEHFDGCDSVIISFWSSQA